MKSLRIEGTKTTPSVILDPNPNNPIFEISGMSISDDLFNFYNPIYIWLEEYFKNPLPKTIFDFKLEFFNTASSKYLLDILIKLEDMKDERHKVKIRWHYPDDDDDDLSIYADELILV